MVKRARRLASIGEKDRARDMARFVRNSCIVDILKPFSGELLIDAHRLDWELRELESECHPASPALSDLDKFSEILSRLDLIAAHVSTGCGVQAADLILEAEKDHNLFRLATA
jgi:hypothetical protein